MTGDLIEFSNSVVRIPVAGPAPNNTLVYVRAQFPSHTETTEGGLSRWPIFGVTLYQIDGFSQAHAHEYLEHTRFSVTAYLNYAKSPTEQDFVVAIDEVFASINADGTVAINGRVGIMDDDFGGMACDFWVSAYILTKEPQPDFTRPPIRWNRTDIVRQAAKQGQTYSDLRRLNTRHLGKDEAWQTPSLYSKHRIVDDDCR